MLLTASFVVSPWAKASSKASKAASMASRVVPSSSW